MLFYHFFLSLKITASLTSARTLRTAQKRAIFPVFVVSDLYPESRLFGYRSPPPKPYNSSSNSSRHNARVSLSGPRLVCRSEDSWRAFGCTRPRCPDKAYWFGCQLVRRLLFRGGNVLAKWRLHFTLSVRMHEQLSADIQRVATLLFRVRLLLGAHGLHSVVWEIFGLLYRTGGGDRVRLWISPWGVHSALVLTALCCYHCSVKWCFVSRLFVNITSSERHCANAWACVGAHVSCPSPRVQGAVERVVKWIWCNGDR